MASLNLHKAVQEYLSGVKTDMTTRMESHDRNASKRSVRSLTESIIENANTTTGRLTGSKSWLTMEQGRKPGPVPVNFKQIIKAWIIDKGISVKPIQTKRKPRNSSLTPQERGLNRLAGAIATTIRKKGTRLHRKHLRDDIYTSPLNKRMQELRRNVSYAVITEVTRMNKEYAKI